MRKKHFVSASLLLASLALVGAGCGQKASESTSATPTKNQQPAVPSATTSDACGNPYYPFKPGLAITYGTTSSANAAANPDYTIRIVGVSGTTATIRSEMADGVTLDLQADCASGSVAMKGTFDLGAAAQDLKIKTTVVSSSGTFMPANVVAGSTWSNSQTVRMDSTGSSAAVAAMGPLTITTVEQSRAVGEESVTVAAGTYKAIKVELTRTTTTEFSGTSTGLKLPPGMKLPTPPPTVSTSTEWWVKGIGMVKSVTSSEGNTSTVEAKSITGL